MEIAGLLRRPPAQSINHPQGIGDEERIEASRLTMASWLRGTGVEVGAGDRPFPVPAGLEVLYGDIRDGDALQKWFGNDRTVGGDQFIDAQTFLGVDSDSFDFVISAHVIEHLFDPIGAVGAAARVTRGGGLLIFTVPNMLYTFDWMRPETTLEHVLADALDGGVGTRRQAYEEHCAYIHPVFAEPIPEDQQPHHVDTFMAAGGDIHVHAWTPEGFRAVLDVCEERFNLRVEAQVSVSNETTYALRKL